jgi:DNA-binding NarL/FixJ family response regulator
MPLTIALVDDYDIVVMGVAHILEQYQDRVVIAELDTNKALSDMVDIVLYDSFAQPESDHDQIRAPGVWRSTPGTSTPT